MSFATDYAEISTHGGIIDLSSRVKLSFTGTDRLRYLNGQVTAKLSGKQGIQPACVTTAKGKLCAEIFIGTWPSEIIIDADAAVAATLLPRMEKYIVADDVAIEDLSSRAALIHGVGITTEQLQSVLEWPHAPAKRVGIPGIDLAPIWREDFPGVWEKLTARFPVISPELAETLRIEAGIPRWGYELDENTLPAEAGLDRTHIDFHKGCYIGQETISRIKSVGHVNRSLHGFVSANGEAIPAPSRISLASAPGEALGNITSTAFSPRLNTDIALGYLKRNAPPGALLAISGDGKQTGISHRPLGWD